jgi:hypothetical protein
MFGQHMMAARNRADVHEMYLRMYREPMRISGINTSIQKAEISRNTLTSKAYDCLAYGHFQAEMEAAR